jgi:hypothetical protein
MAIKQGKTLQHMCKGKDDDVFWLCNENYREKKNFFGSCQKNSSLHRSYALIFFFVKALSQ